MGLMRSTLALRSGNCPHLLTSEDWAGSGGMPPLQMEGKVGMEGLDPTRPLNQSTRSRNL